MTKLQRECFNAAKTEAAKFNASISFERGTKHLLLVVTINGRSMKFATSCGHAARQNQVHWIVQDVRRMAKELTSC